jgi:tetratricopeptide (TPR) repeat protein
MRLYVGEACAYSFLGQWVQARERAAQATGIAQGDRTLAVESSAHAVLGVAIAFLGDPPAGEQELRRALDLAREASSTEDLAQIHLDLGEVLRLQAGIEDALGMMLEGERVALAAGNHRAGNFLAVNAADDLLRLGRWDELEERLSDLESRHLDQPAQLLLDSLAGRLDTARGRFDQAASRFDAAAVLCDSLGLVEFVPAVFSGYAELELWRHQPLAAQSRISDGLSKLGAADNLLHIPVLHSMGARAAADGAQNARAQGNPQEGDRAERALLEHHDSLNTVVEARGIEAIPAEATGHLAICAAELTRGTNSPTPDAWAEAVSGWRTLSNPYKLAYLVYRYAEALLLTESDRPRAEATLQEGHALCVKLGAAPLLTAIRSLARTHAVELWGTLAADRGAG